MCASACLRWGVTMCACVRACVCVCICLRVLVMGHHDKAAPASAVVGLSRYQSLTTDFAPFQEKQPGQR